MRINIIMSNSMILNEYGAVWATFRNPPWRFSNTEQIWTPLDKNSLTAFFENQCSRLGISGINCIISSLSYEFKVLISSDLIRSSNSLSIPGRVDVFLMNLKS